MSSTTTQTIAVLSMLHEPADQNSSTRLFRTKPVLDWTLSRLRRADNIHKVAIVCWEDQLFSVHPIAQAHETYVLAKGPRMRIGELEAISAARRWADGWRGGLLGTTDFDSGFYAPWIAEVLEKIPAESLVLVDPSSGLIDAELVDALVSQSREFPDVEFCFTPAGPGLGGMLLRKEIIERMRDTRSHPGRLLQYSPDLPNRDPLGMNHCAPVPTPVARTLHRFKMDSDRQIQKLAQATVSLNGSLIDTHAEELVRRLNIEPMCDAFPREVVVELTTRRLTKPIFSPLCKQGIDRADMTDELFECICAEAKRVDDLRLTFAGVGDPLLHRGLFGFIERARIAGIRAIHVETDLVEFASGSIDQLIQSGVDVLSIHIPAGNGRTYVQIMGADAMGKVMSNLQALIDLSQRRGGGVPLIVPVFTKCAANLAEMEACYDHWLRTLGHCVVTGPSTFGGLIPDTAAADMTPPKRRPCARLWSRMTILSTGQVTSCEQDVLGQQILGQIGNELISDIWKTRQSQLRQAHEKNDLSKCELCMKCREWHRP